VSGPERAYSAAEAIDQLMAPSDGKLLAAIAFYKTNVGSLFGMPGVMAMVKQKVEAAPCVRFASDRALAAAGRSPRAMLKVDDAKAYGMYPALAQWLSRQGVKGPEGLGYGGTGNTANERELKRIVNFKSAVISEEVTKQVVNEMNEAVRPHWPRAKGILRDIGAMPEFDGLIVSSIFGIGLNRDYAVHSRDKVVILSALV
jgi:hypothetical protein